MRMDHIRRDPAQTRLTRALVASASAAGLIAAVEDARAHPWSSATFTGARHVVLLSTADSPARAAWLATLPEAEWCIPGHIVADLAIDEVAPDTVTLTLLLLADA